LKREFVLKESIVRDYINKWLEKRWKRTLKEKTSNVDFLIWESPIWGLEPVFSLSWLVYLEQIECKGTNSGVHRAVGQCMDYYFSNDCIPTYLAVPEDYKQLKTLEQLIKFFSLPIGILLVNNEGEISTKTEAKGKKRYFKLFRNEKGNLTNKPAHPQLHFLQ